MSRKSEPDQRLTAFGSTTGIMVVPAMTCSLQTGKHVLRFAREILRSSRCGKQRENLTLGPKANAGNGRRTAVRVAVANDLLAPVFAVRHVRPEGPLLEPTEAESSERFYAAYMTRGSEP